MENDQNQELELTEIEETGADTEFETENVEETVTIPKSKFNSIKRKAIAYDAAKEKPKTEPITNRSSDDKWKQRMELKVDGYDDEAIDFLLKNGGKKALENPYIVAAVESIKTKKAAEAATITQDSGRSSIDKRFTPQEFAKLSHEDQLKAMAELS